MKPEWSATREQARINRERKEEKRRFLRQRVAALHAEGLATRTIGQRLSVSPGVILDVMHALGLTPNWGKP